MTTILMAVMLVGLIGIGALAVDLGIAFVTRSELQNASDAAVLAGTHELAVIYKAHPDWIMGPLQSGLNDVEDTTKEYAGLNNGWGVSIALLDDDLVVGKYDDNGTITATGTAVRAVRVKSRRDEQSNGTLATGLAKVIGIDEMGVTASSAAALTPIGTLNGGQGDFPIGISKQWFNSHKCGDDDQIVLFPTSTTSCAGWHTFTEKPASASKLGTVVDGLRTGSFKAPVTVAGETYYQFIGGTVESRCSNLKELFDAKKVGGKMMANVPVYDFDCGNVSGATKIIGFVKAEIQQVVCGNNNRRLEVKVECGVVDQTVGSGGGEYDFGLITSAGSMIY